MEAKSARTLVASCAIPAGPGMEVSIGTPKVHTSRRLNIELMLASGNHNCLTCEKNRAYQYGITDIRFKGQTQQYPTDDSNSMIIRDSAIASSAASACRPARWAR